MILKVFFENSNNSLKLYHFHNHVFWFNMIFNGNLILPVCKLLLITQTHVLFNQVDGIGTGAGHAAPGGSQSLDIVGGGVYGLTRAPADIGSGGGSSTILGGQGGSGGGWLELRVHGTLWLDGMSLWG